MPEATESSLEDSGAPDLQQEAPGTLEDAGVSTVPVVAEGSLPNDATPPNPSANEPTTTVASWLEGLTLGQYVEKFTSQGFDGAFFLCRVENWQHGGTTAFPNPCFA